MKITTDANWTKLAGALIASRDAWRRLLHRPDIPTDVRTIAGAQSGRITQALKHPVSRKEGNANASD